MNKIALTIVTFGLIAALGLIFVGGNSGKDDGNVSAQAVELRDGVQYVTVNAGGGYTPRTATAQAGIPTKLIVKTDGTFDCSSSLVIRSLGFQKILPQTGETSIDLGTPKAGVPIEGVCSMGMYSFKIDFI